MSAEQTVNVRYMVDDVSAAVDFYMSHLGFEVERTFRPRSPTSLEATCACSSAAPRALPGVRCPTVPGRVPVDGIASTSSPRISTARSPG
jgi:Glyoxalase/Bleomycin resistance protein/Dioxygenase superfamily